MNQPLESTENIDWISVGCNGVRGKQHRYKHWQRHQKQSAIVLALLRICQGVQSWFCQFQKTLRWWSWIWINCVLSFLSCKCWYCCYLILFQEKPCDYPAIENGRLSETLEYYKNYYFPMRFGQHADYHCVNGYSTPSGEYWARMVCSERGWYPEPKCLSKYISTIWSILL